MVHATKELLSVISAPSLEQFDNLWVASQQGGLESIAVCAAMRVDIRSLV